MVLSFLQFYTATYSEWSNAYSFGVWKREGGYNLTATFKSVCTTFYIKVNTTTSDMQYHNK